MVTDNDREIARLLHSEFPKTYIETEDDVYLAGYTIRLPTSLTTQLKELGARVRTYKRASGGITTVVAWDRKEG